MIPASNPYSSINYAGKRHALAFLHFVNRFFKWVCLKLFAFCILIKRLIHELWYGAEDDKPKIIIFYPNFWQRIRKCAIHFVPLAATAVLAGLNFKGYFIGEDFQGFTSELWQNFDKLAVQVAAKIYVSL